MTILPNGLTVKTDVGNVALPTCSKTTSGASPRTRRTALAKSRVTAKRAFSSSGVSPPRRIMPAKSLRSMNPRAPSCSTRAPTGLLDPRPLLGRRHDADALGPRRAAELRREDAEAARGAPDEHAVAG